MIKKIVVKNRSMNMNSRVIFRVKFNITYTPPNILQLVWACGWY